MREGVVSYISCNVISDAVVDRAHQPLRECGYTYQHCRPGKKRNDAIKVNKSLADNKVYSVTDQYRNVERERNRDECQKHRYR